MRVLRDNLRKATKPPWCTCVTALFSSLGTNVNARRAAVVHLLFNVIGTHSENFFTDLPDCDCRSFEKTFVERFVFLLLFFTLFVVDDKACEFARHSAAITKLRVSAFYLPQTLNNGASVNRTVRQQRDQDPTRLTKSRRTFP